MSLPRKFLGILLAACVLLAQLQGFAHSVAHLGVNHEFRATSATHAQLCADCAAFAQAGAAPMASPAPASPATADIQQALARVDADASERTSAYRSRAPPAAST
jgi:hypothetical protein